MEDTAGTGGVSRHERVVGKEAAAGIVAILEEQGRVELENQPGPV